MLRPNQAIGVRVKNSMEEEAEEVLGETITKIGAMIMTEEADTRETEADTEEEMTEATVAVVM